MGRSWALGLAAASLLMAAGCSQSGSYRLSWVFVVDKYTGQTQSSAVGCGQHGVDSILANGTDGNGNSVQVIALCVPGQFNGTAQPGKWSFTAQMLDAEQKPIPVPTGGMPTKQPDAATITAGGPVALFPIQFWPPDTCGDYIDNDRDGRVDTGGECDGGTLGQPDGGAPRDSGTPTDAAQQDGGPADGGDGGPRDGGGSLDARG
jgi:hypothetical protein